MNEHDEQMAAMLPALCLPEDRAQWPAWLEQQLMGVELPKLCKQLVTLGGQHPAATTLEAVLGAQRSAVLQQGLQGNLNTQQLTKLLAQPALLLELQALILLEGGDFWTQVAPLPANTASVEAARKNVLPQLSISPNKSGPMEEALRGKPSSVHASDHESLARPSDSLASGQPGRSTWLWLAALAATAAAVLLAVMNPFRASPSGQFFAAQELQASAATPQAALVRMAQRVQADWKRDLASDQEFQNQLVAFRDSCEYLIDGPLVKTLDGLPNEVILDIQQRCRNWQKQASDLIAKLKEGQPAATIRQEADALIDKLANKLRELGSV